MCKKPEIIYKFYHEKKPVVVPSLVELLKKWWCGTLKDDASAQKFKKEIEENGKKGVVALPINQEKVPALKEEATVLEKNVKEQEDKTKVPAKKTIG